MNSNIFILMGVAAAGKTTLGKTLAEATNGLFYDGDDFHSAGNRRKMESGIALTDEDRKDWLESIAQVIATHANEPRPTFIACSALKQSYREVLFRAHPSLRFLFLSADPETLRQRITSRYQSGQHFMPPELLDSQLATLEIPEEAIELDASKPVSELVKTVLSVIKPEPV